MHFCTYRGFSMPPAGLEPALCLQKGILSLVYLNLFCHSTFYNKTFLIVTAICVY